MTIELNNVVEAGAFDYRWPQQHEHFASSWIGIGVDGREQAAFRHGIGEREVYGESRVHTVTFLNGDPVVEGVAADDYESTRALLSLIKPYPGHRLAREPSEVPDAYGEFEVVSHRDEINAPYSKRCLAVKVAVDDLDRWVTHALTRRKLRERAT